MNDNFPKNPTDSSLPEIGMSNPNNSAFMEQGQFTGGKTKIRPTSKDGTSYQGTSGYGFMTNDASMKAQGFAPSGENSSGIPAAQPIDPITFGDPNDTAVDANDHGTTQGSDVTRRGF